MLKFPGITIENTVKLLLQAIRNDYIVASDKSKTFLSKSLGVSSRGSYNMLQQSVAIFMTQPDNPRHLRVHPSFNIEKNQIPSIHINMPSDQSGYRDGLGIDEGLSYDTETGYNKTYERGFTKTYSIVIVSDNRNEIELIYEIIKMCIVAAFDHLAFEGFENPQVSGNDMRLMEIPGNKRIMMRAINIRFSYRQEIRKFDVSQLLNSINFDGDPYDKNEKSESISF